MSDRTATGANPVLSISGKRLSKRVALMLCAAAFYAPYAWLLFVESLCPWHSPQWDWTQLGITPWKWSDHHWLWIKLWPALPGLIPSLWFKAVIGIGRLADWFEFLVGGVITLVLLGTVGWTALRREHWTTATLSTTFLISCLFSWM